MCQNAIIKFLKHCISLSLLYMIDFLFTQGAKKNNHLKVLFTKGCSKMSEINLNTLFNQKKFKISKSTTSPLFLQSVFFFLDQPYQLKIFKAFVKVNVGFISQVLVVQIQVTHKELIRPSRFSS